MPTPMIKIFWDLASCPPPASYESLAEILKDIRCFTSSLGSVTSIKAYWDRDDPQHTGTNAKTESFRHFMPSMGINLIDGSSMPGYTQDALTRMLTVDVLVSAMDDLGRTERDVIMIISGAESVLYPISLLMFRNYTVFLVTPDKSNMQPFQATRVFSWHTDVLSTKPDPDSNHTAVPAEEPSKPTGWTANGHHAPQLELSDLETVAPSIRSASSAPPSYIASPSYPTTTTTTTPATTPKTEARPVTASEPPVSRAHSVASSNRDPPPHKKAGVALNEKAAKNTKSSPAPPSTKVPSQAPKSPAVPEKDVTKTEVDPSDDWSHFGGNWNTGGGWVMTGAEWSNEPVEGPNKTEAKRAEPDKKQEVKSATAKKTQSHGKGPRPGQEPKKSAPKPENKPPVVKSTNDPPAFVFTPLLEILREVEDQSMLRSQLGSELAKRDPDRTLYQNANVKGLSEYLTLANQKNLVALFGIDNHQRVKLKSN